jgi:hypothetical protein
MAFCVGELFSILVLISSTKEVLVKQIPILYTLTTLEEEEFR